ncbi:hypothetical protein Mapa_007866 [Marchantia paleacea]|nr:hypothetical protein Mapa_007866 [Marchantia paleacea]
MYLAVASDRKLKERSRAVSPRCKADSAHPDKLRICSGRQVESPWSCKSPTALRYT